MSRVAVIVFLLYLRQNAALPLSDFSNVTDLMPLESKLVPNLRTTVEGKEVPDIPIFQTDQDMASAFDSPKRFLLKDYFQPPPRYPTPGTEVALESENVMTLPPRPPPPPPPTPSLTSSPVTTSLPSPSASLSSSLMPPLPKMQDPKGRGRDKTNWSPRPVDGLLNRNSDTNANRGSNSESLMPQFNRNKERHQESLLKLNSNSDHVEDILSRFRGNFTGLSTTETGQSPTTTLNTVPSESPMDQYFERSRETMQNKETKMNMMPTNGRIRSNEHLKYNENRGNGERERQQQEGNKSGKPTVSSAETAKPHGMGGNLKRINSANSLTISGPPLNSDPEREREGNSNEEKMVQNQQQQQPQQQQQLLQQQQQQTEDKQSGGQYMEMPDVMFNDGYILAGSPPAPLFTGFRPTNSFLGHPQLLQFPLPGKLRSSPFGYPVQYPRFYSPETLGATIETNADTNKVDHADPDSDSSQDDVPPTKEAAFPVAAKLGLKGNAIGPNYGGNIALQKGIHQGYPGPVLTCCKVIYPHGHHGLHGHALGQRQGHIHHPQGLGLGPNKQVPINNHLIHPELGMCFDDTLGPHNWLHYKKMKLLSLPFLFKKRLLFG